MTNHTFSIRFSREDGVLLRQVMLHDPKCENPSQVMYYSFRDARKNGFDIKRAAAYKIKKTDIEIPAEEYTATRSFSVEEQDWDFAVETYREQLNVERVRISSLARLILKNRMLFLEAENDEEEKKITNIDGVELLKRVNDYAAELIRAGEIATVMNFIKERRK